MTGSRILSSLLLFSSSLLLANCRAIRSGARDSPSCTSESSAPVIAWSDEYCHIDSTSSDLAPVPAEAGMSCPAVSHNSKCFPIWQRDAESSDSAFGSRDETPYKTRPIRQAPVQQTLTSGPRSISLRWPDGIQHAVFYTDDVCHNVQVGRPEFTWHVERLGTQAAQCESPPAGLFKSVEFMEAEEYEEFSKRMRGQDAPGSKARWRSII